MPVDSIQVQSKHLRLNINSLLLSTVMYFCVVSLNLNDIAILDAVVINLALGVISFACIFSISLFHSLVSVDINEWSLSDKWTSVVTYVWSIAIFIALIDALAADMSDGSLAIGGLLGKGLDGTKAASYTLVAAIVLLLKSVVLFRKCNINWFRVVLELGAVVTVNSVLFYIMVYRLPEFLTGLQGS